MSRLELALNAVLEDSAAFGVRVEADLKPVVPSFGNGYELWEWV